MGNIFYLVIVLLIVFILFPYLPVANGFRFHPIANGSLWTLVAILILLRVFGII